MGSEAPPPSRRAIIRRNAARRPGPAATTVPIDATEGIPIDIIFLVERLESIIANGRRLPLTSNVVVDQAAALGLIDELRVAVPEEVRAAKRINSEGERIIEKAQEEAERIVAKAQEQAAFLIDERGLTQQAEADSRRIIGEAESDAEDVRRGADEYAVNVLVGLEGDVVKTLQSIKKGIDLLDSRRADLRGGETDGIVPDNGVDDEAFEDVPDDEGQPQPVRR
jgi:F0F1-type ATP synthase membrane subunit b/b'